MPISLNFSAGRKILAENKYLIGPNRSTFLLKLQN